MSYISHDLKGAVVTWKGSYGPIDHDEGSNLVSHWPFPLAVRQAKVVAAALTVGNYPRVLLVLQAPNGDLGEFVARHTRVIEKLEVGDAGPAGD